jgi:hypothetical protein
MSQRKHLILLLIALLVLTVSACGKKEKKEEEKPYEFNLSDTPVYKYQFWNQDQDSLPIGVWSDPPAANFAGIYNNPDLINEQQYAWIKESGVNVVYGLYNNIVLNKEDVMRSLDLSEQYDITYLVRDSQVTGSYDDDDIELLRNTLNLYKEHPAFGGSMVVDEPGTASFANLGNLHKNYQTIVSDRAFYINMLPNYASKNQLVNGAVGGTLNDSTITYERYMNSYINQVKPDFYSYDFYPFVGMEYAKMRSGYFAQMAQIREITLNAGIPFWTFIQASSWAPGSLRVPNQAEIYWQVATSIAMGAKGIQYFMYYTSMEQGAESFSGGMVDQNGNKNPMYDYVKNANMHLKTIESIIMNASNEGVMVHGDSPDEIPASVIKTTYSGLNHLSGDDMLVGLFNYKQKPAYYVVNNSLTNLSGSHTITFDQAFTINVYEGSQMRTITTNEITLTIGAGEGVLIEIVS